MNREWSDKNKLAQSKLKKATFYDGINEFLKLREMLMQKCYRGRSYCHLTIIVQFRLLMLMVITLRR